MNPNQISNKEIAEQLNLLAKLIEIHGENSFRAKAYSTAAFKIEKLSYNLAEKPLEQVRIAGIGEGILAAIKEIITSGQFALLQEYLEKTPAGVLDLLKVKGLGPKKIAQLWKGLEIESIDELSDACTENKLMLLKGFGLASQNSILKSIEFLRAQKGFFFYAAMEELAEQLLDLILNHFPTQLTSFTGAWRRQETVINKLELLTTAPLQAVSTFLKEQFSAALIDIQEPFLIVEMPEWVKVVIEFCSEENFYNRLFETTNTVAFNEAFLSRYQLPVTPISESEIFEKNTLSIIHPALRESELAIERYGKASIQLIQTSDIKGVIHSHSTYSDGRNSIQEMALATQKKGYEYLVMSDHSQTAAYANGLSVERILQQHHEIDQLNQEMKDFKIFKSIESDILNDGSLDYEDSVLAQFDLVIASIHSNLGMDEEQAMERLIKAIENPYTRILGHPTGRLLLSRPGYPVNHKKLIDACFANDVVVEINAHPRRLDLDWKWIEYAIDKGVLLSINPDAHSTEGIDLIKYGVLAAQKGGLTPISNLSSFSLIEFENFLKQK